MEEMYSAPHHQDHAAHPQRFSSWPSPAPNMHAAAADLYDRARQAAIAGLPPPRVDTTTALNTTAWKREATGHPADHIVLQGIVYGFPIQYNGPPVTVPTPTYNHQSADAHPGEVDAYMEKELSAGALSGPYTTPPFAPWFASSPIMTREKSGGQGRRIIVDLSFPDGGINQYVLPHVFNGRDAVHNLPTIESAVSTIAATSPGDVHLAVVDLSRAYRQFPVIPLDWPLLGIYWRGAWAFDRRLPFGCRMSSFTMQTVAEFIVRALSTRTVKIHMYLDDIIMISATSATAERDFAVILRLLDDLGLEVAVKKLQRPSQIACWLGITIDLTENRLSIPPTKLGQIKDCMAAASRRNYITKKHLQRLIGLANHVTKVVRAARVFICRLLAALRAATTNSIKVTRDIRADLRWYARHLSESDGRAVIPVDRIVLRIWADACLKGAGASDGSKFYEHVFSTQVAETHHIVHLEAVNCLAAVRSFVVKGLAGGTIEIMCDNRASVDAFTSGRARDGVLAACARALWYHAAEMDVDLKFTHVPGEAMALPDALSRASLDAASRNKADQLIRRLSLRRVTPGEGVFNYNAFT